MRRGLSTLTRPSVIAKLKFAMFVTYPIIEPFDGAYTSKVLPSIASRAGPNWFAYDEMYARNPLPLRVNTQVAAIFHRQACAAAWFCRANAGEVIFAADKYTSAAR
jgi:hypothetical protein